MDKFPVTSESGNEYRVSVYADHRWNTYVASVYAPAKLFGFWKYWKFLSGGEFYGRYSMKECNYDLVEIAKQAVIKYEGSIKEELLHEKKIKDSFQKFKEWNGEIK